MTSQTTTPRAVLYVRISDDPEGSEKGVDRQETDCRFFAEAQGYEVVEVFRENDTSAFKQRTITLPTGEKVRRVVRPRFRAMLSLLARHGAEAMIAYDLDRAVRDPRDLEDLIDAKVLYGFRVLSTTGGQVPHSGCSYCCQAASGGLICSRMAVARASSSGSARVPISSRRSRW